MAVNDNTIMAIFVLTFIYLVVYKKNRFIGSILLFGTSLMIWQNTSIYAGYGFVLFMLSLINMLWETTTIFGFGQNSKMNLNKIGK